MPGNTRSYLWSSSGKSPSRFCLPFARQPSLSSDKEPRPSDDYPRLSPVLSLAFKRWPSLKVFFYIITVSEVSTLLPVTHRLPRYYRFVSGASHKLLSWTWISGAFLLSFTSKIPALLLALEVRISGSVPQVINLNSSGFVITL